MDNISGASTAPFSVGSILGRTWNTMMQNPAAYLGLTFVVSLLAMVINIGLNLLSLNIGNPNMGSLLGSIVSMVLNLMAAGAIVYVAFQHLRGVRVGMKEGLAYAASRIAPLFLAALVLGLGIGIGMILLIVPGVIFACAAVAAIPVCMVEKLGPLDCIRRSMALTKHKSSKKESYDLRRCCPDRAGDVCPQFPRRHHRHGPVFGIRLFSSHNVLLCRSAVSSLHPGSEHAVFPAHHRYIC